ncbi:Hypothetical predicted protein [Octopus vulgaris]|uniref:Uncharacterized protein n=1 Tax=Octopus vulgaris TaxID=6645 RepID=A0AA36AL11_OCTVU|nr:Hypothetical predicted protein [Octopus vulgaris]
METPELLMARINEDKEKRQQDLRNIKENKVFLTKLEKNIYSTLEQLQAKLASELEDNKRLSMKMEKIDAEKEELASALGEKEEKCQIIEAELNSLKEAQERHKQYSDKEIKDLKEKYAKLLQENQKYKQMEDEYKMLKEEFKDVHAKNQVYEKRFSSFRTMSSETTEPADGVHTYRKTDLCLSDEQHYENLNNQLRSLNNQMEECIRGWQNTYLEDPTSKEKNDDNK